MRKSALKPNKLVCNSSKLFSEKHKKSLKNAIIMVFFPIISFLGEHFLKHIESMLRISLREPKICRLGTPFSESDCFHYLLFKNIIFSENIYSINMSKFTLKCTKLHHILKIFLGAAYP